MEWMGEVLDDDMVVISKFSDRSCSHTHIH